MTLSSNSDDDGHTEHPTPTVFDGCHQEDVRRLEPKIMPTSHFENASQNVLYDLLNHLPILDLIA